MKALLVNAPWQRPGWYGVRAGSRWPHLERAESPYMPFPFLMGYAAAVLEQDGVDVGVVDACAERLALSAFLDRVEAADPDVLVAEISSPSFHVDMAALSALRQRGYEGKVVVAGLHKPAYDADFLAPGRNVDIDGVLIGEYELTLRELLRHQGAPSEPLPGLLWRSREAVLDGGRKPSQPDLDDLPWPARHLFPMDRYHDCPGGIPTPSVQLWASRGCSFQCSFCAWPQILYADNRYRVRSPGAVADEVVAMLDQGHESFYFDDDTFNLGRERTAALGRALRKRRVRAPWAFMGRADTCEPSQYEDLVATGLAAVKFGVESADNGRLKDIGKRLEVERVRQTVAAVKALGVKVHLTFMFGLPGETLETMQRTLDLAYELDPDSAQFTVAVPFPGSRLFDELSEQGRLAGADLEDLDGYRTGVVSTEALEPDQIIQFTHAVHSRWERRSRPAGPAPRIPIAEIGGSGVAVGLVAPAGSGQWLNAALKAVVEQEGPAREIVVVADPQDAELEQITAGRAAWATYLESQPGEAWGAAANRIAPACAGRWIALLRPGALPAPGWLQAVIEATGLHPQVGALACGLDTAAGPRLAALDLSRWGAVRARAPGHEESAVVAVSGGAGVFSRTLLEDVGGFPAELDAPLAEAELGLRGLLLGYSCESAPAARVALRGAEDDADRWLARLAGDRAGRGRVRLLVRAMPREALAAAGPAVALELAADLLRAVRRGDDAAAMLGGVLGELAGISGLREERRAVLGRRRIGPRRALELMTESERVLGARRWQALLAALSR